MSQAEITDEAKARIPALANLEVLLAKYRSCFSIEITDEGAALILSRTKLQALGLPAQLPELLEYGSEMGIAPMVHLRTAKLRFRRETIPSIAAEVKSELE